MKANQTLHDFWPPFWLVQYIYIYIYFWGLLPPNGILPPAKTTLRPSFAFSYILAALLHGTQAAAVSQTLWRGITEHSYLLSEEDQPTCTKCDTVLTVKHILLDCSKLQDVQLKYFTAKTLLLL